ncbi:Fe-S cluster assembly protein IscX [Rickettsia endosymbiont of Halotydeus destructor]|uniref:Fe-S cluster assembly protein IscX n=1 Tax=Rickettsia endosymbiont of Halotydeus destructor TaxID=2996754 RepID=UPI003BB1296D
MHWFDVEEIAIQLEENYPNDYEGIKLLDLKQLITSLDDFEDQEVEVQKATLEEIRDKWSEIREGLSEEENE